MLKTSEYGQESSTMFPWLMYGVAALFYCFVYFLRVSPGMMEGEIRNHFLIDATQFGLFTTLYYYAYSPMQLVVGAIIDRYGAKLVLFTACLISMSGIYLFGTATSFYVACVGRFLIGLGSSFGYVTILKVASLWLPPKRFAAAAGLTTAFGMIAAIITEKYLASAIKTTGFQSWLHTSLIIGILLAVLFITVLRAHPSRERTNILSRAEIIQGYKQMISNPQCWYIGIVGGLLYLPAMVFLDVSGPAYFHTAYGLDKSQAATMVNLVFAGWIIGGPTIGMISDHIKRRKAPLMISSVIAMVLICMIFYVQLSMTTLTICMLLLGFTCGAHPLVFSLGKENCPIRFSGTATAFTNFLVMLGGFALLAYGKLLDYHFAHYGGVTAANGTKIYSMGDYTFALTLIPVGLGIALVLSALIKETYAQSYQDDSEGEPAFEQDQPARTVNTTATA